MGDKAKGRNNGKVKKAKTLKTAKHGLRPHEERARQEQFPKKLS